MQGGTYSQRFSKAGSVVIARISGWKSSVRLNSISVWPSLYVFHCGVITSDTGCTFGSPDLAKATNAPANEAAKLTFGYGKVLSVLAHFINWSLNEIVMVLTVRWESSIEHRFRAVREEAQIRPRHLLARCAAFMCGMSIQYLVSGTSERL